MIENEYAGTLLFLAVCAWLFAMWVLSHVESFTRSYAVDLATGAFFSLTAGLLFGSAILEFYA